MDQRLANRIAVITGASSGLGRATAFRFADAGARIVCADLKDSDVTEGIQKKHGADRAIFVACNVTSEDEIKNLIQATVKWGGRLDIICNYAGITTEVAHKVAMRVHDTHTADFDRTWAVNTRGVWLCCKHAIQQMLVQEPLPPNARGDRTRGKIVNAASMFGLVGFKQSPCYSPSKHAVVGLTKQIALDYAEDRIHCNCLCPGFVKSPMISSFIETPEDQAAFASMHPWNALGTPKDVADAALFLACDESAWVTGHAMIIDGGYTAQ